MRAFRIMILVSLLAGLSWFAFFTSASPREVAALALDNFDGRPARSILFIGNSRTYTHGMPYMVREMADSAGADKKYQIRMYARPGRSLRQQWEDPEVQRLIGQEWDDVVLQEQSGGHYEQRSEDFRTYGAQLVRAAADKGSRPVMFVGWNYSTAVFASAPGWESRYYQLIQDDHFRLSRETGAGLANVGQVWRYVVAANPPFQLETDGNHPSLHGSYLAALVIYTHLSGRSVEDVRYVPDGLPENDAALLRELAAKALSAA